ncbi:MAG TPA: hypothetical protein VIT62_16665 [Lysobacter sp.]
MNLLRANLSRRNDWLDFFSGYITADATNPSDAIEADGSATIFDPHAA